MGHSISINRPLWGSGIGLAPQTFQQQAAWEARTNECIAQLARAHPWGVRHVSVDATALRLGVLKLAELNVRLPDGSLIDSTAGDALPPAVELASTLDSQAQAAVFLVALPLEHGNGGNCVMDGSETARAVRYRQVWRDLQDAYDDGRQPIAVLEPRVELRLQSTSPGEAGENAQFATCAVLRLVRDGNAGWALDTQFVPPLLCLAAHAGLLLRLQHLHSQLAAKRTRLMSMRRESHQRMADFAVADVSLFWLLNALNSCQPVLAEFIAHPDYHPEALYLELARLAGSLSTFSLDDAACVIPAYDHRQLDLVFMPLLALIANLLETSLPSRVISLALTGGGNRWQVALHDPRLREPDGVDFYLSVRSPMPAAALQVQFPRLCKAGAPEAVDRLVNAALEGIPLISLAHVPAAIAMRLGNQYFALDLEHAEGRAMLDAGVCAFHVPATLADVQLELFAVLRS